MPPSPRKLFYGILTTGLAVAFAASPLAATEVAPPDLEALLAQNRKLQQEVEQQQHQIDELRGRLDSLSNSNQQSAKDRPTTSEEAPPAQPARGDFSGLRSAREIRLSGEAGFAFFSSGRNGGYPNSEFRVDEAKLFVEAPIWKNVYFFTGIELTTREANDEYFHVGELYADMEDVFKSGRDYSLSLRVGRFNLPFGEEYQYRSVTTNPLILHSLEDIWGIDEGVQAYGSLGPLQYNLAVQNGGHKALHDYNKDKSITARVSYNPINSLHLSASFHRTGKLDVVNDGLSEIWFANDFFRALGPTTTTKTFSARLYELDAIWHWKEGHFQATSGEAWFEDDNTAANDSRHFTFYSLEAMQQITGKLYGALRYGKLRAPGGYPLAGLGNVGNYFYNPFGPRTTDLERFSAGLGYQFDLPIVWKVEYSWENGHLVGGVRRGDSDTWATELGLKF